MTRSRSRRTTVPARPDPSDPDVLRENTPVPPHQFAARRRDVLVEALRRRVYRLEGKVDAALEALRDPHMPTDKDRVDWAVEVLEADDAEFMEDDSAEA